MVDDYEPEPWDVVRVADGMVIVPAVGITVADDACLFLNKNAVGPFRRKGYEVRESNAEGGNDHE